MKMEEKEEEVAGPKAAAAAESHTKRAGKRK
jgi:hypothetical protein